jgi:hypothetical protein
MRQDITEKLVSFYRDDVPGYIRDAGRTFLKIQNNSGSGLGYCDLVSSIKKVAMISPATPSAS